MVFQNKKKEDEKQLMIKRELRRLKLADTSENFEKQKRMNVF